MVYRVRLCCSFGLCAAWLESPASVSWRPPAQSCTESHVPVILSSLTAAGKRDSPDSCHRHVCLVLMSADTVVVRSAPQVYGLRPFRIPLSWDFMNITDSSQPFYSGVK